MNLTDKLTAELKRLAGSGSTSPQSLSLSGPDGIDVEIDFTTVDTLSSSLREIRLNVPSLQQADTDVLERWAKALSERVTYLLENIGPLEIDRENQQVLIRSTPPDQQAGSTKFYEMLLRSHDDGNFSLKRYVSENGTPGRMQVDIQATHELLGKLIDDLVDTVPENA